MAASRQRFGSMIMLPMNRMPLTSLADIVLSFAIPPLVAKGQGVVDVTGLGVVGDGDMSAASAFATCEPPC